MMPKTEALWAKQDKHKGDRLRLFSAVASAVAAETVLYPGCFVDIAPSFVFSSVTYNDLDKRTPAFFADEEGLSEIIKANGGPSSPILSFIHGDYKDPLEVPLAHFDLLVSLYAGFVSEHCTQYLKLGGTLLANPSHGDAAMASIDPRYVLSGLVKSDGGQYRITDKDLDSYLVPKKAEEITIESLHAGGRGIGYTRPAFAYLFTRVA